MTVRGLRGTTIAVSMRARGPVMNLDQRAFRRKTRLWPVLLALFCVFAASAPALAKSAGGTVTIRGTIVTKIVIPPSGTGQLTLIDKTLLRVTANKREWYYVYSFVNASGQVVPVTVQSNRPWSGTLTAVQTSGDKKKMDLAGGLLHVSTTRPTTFAQADAATALTTSALNLSSL